MPGICKAGIDQPRILVQSYLFSSHDTEDTRLLCARKRESHVVKVRKSA